MTHVLIVEDHEENRNLLKLLLEANAYRVTAAGDGLEALAAARRDRPDAIVSDALMPKMDGFALCRAWMQDASLSAIPFIFYSATYVRPVDELFSKALGAVRYLIKPLEAEVFLQELRAVLQQWTGRAAPVQAAPLDDATTHALHESALARKLEDKIAQLETANRKLQESEARFRSLTEMSSDFYWESDAEHRLTQRSSADRKLSNVSVPWQHAQIGERRWEIPCLSPDEAGWQAHRAVLDAHQPLREFEFSRLGTDGTEHFISISGDPVFDASGAFTGYRGVGTDISKRKRAENTMRESETRFRSLFESMLDGFAYCRMLYDDRDQPVDFVYLDVNNAFERLTGLKNVVGRKVSEVIPGIRELSPELFEIYGRVASTGVPESFEFDFKSLAKWLTISVYSPATGYFVAIFDDITEKKRAEEQIQRYVAQVENAFMSTVQVVTTLGEMRDPYTAGHQHRVAEIAVAIGAELGFDARRQEGLRVAGYLHDIGKIRIPSEILSKPGKLSPAEFHLVQGHAQASYDVLKDVKFPWPVAEVALLHHERMDGSGYPQGLKGEAILLEARIMAVADVIEAMSSHRPYRAGLGIEAALAEIERGRGSAYDPAVVDVCLKLFREKGYAIPA